jgi:selenide,water dikinase
MMAGLVKFQGPEVVVGVETGDDAGVYRLREDLAIVSTADFITPVIDDPFIYGQVAASNALSDVYAMGGRVVSVLNLCAFPKALEPQVAHDILEGGANKVAEAGGSILGGHTVRNDELLYGLAVTGVVDPRRVVRNVGAQPGDALILTKPLGTGVTINGARKGVTTEPQLREACANMAQLNKTACEIMLRFGVHAATDITGFGLAGHGLGMTRAGGIGLRVEWARLPVYPWARELVAKGVTTGSTRPNRESYGAAVAWSQTPPPDLEPLAYDPQTAGGLMMAIPASQADDCVKALVDAGVQHARRVGEVFASAAARLEIIL